MYPADALVPMVKGDSCHGFAAIYAVVTHISFFWETALGKGDISSPDVSDAMGIMTDTLPCRVRKNYCFLL